MHTTHRAVFLIALTLPLGGCVFDDIYDQMIVTEEAIQRVEGGLTDVQAINTRITENQEQTNALLESIDGTLVRVNENLDQITPLLESVDEDLEPIKVSLTAIDEHLASLRKTLQSLDSTIPFLQFSDDEEVQTGEEIEAEQSDTPETP
ncbi:MAG: hypothetical protein AAGD00_06035 [Planctomycetota bacterium]